MIAAKEFLLREEHDIAAAVATILKDAGVRLILGDKVPAVSSAEGSNVTYHRRRSHGGCAAGSLMT